MICLYVANAYSTIMATVCGLLEPSRFASHKEAESMNENPYVDESVHKLSQRLFKAITYACVDSAHAWTVMRFRVASFMQERVSFSLVN